jgi:hypothetical protein
LQISESTTISSERVVTGEPTFDALIRVGDENLAVELFNEMEEPSS